MLNLTMLNVILLNLTLLNLTLLNLSLSNPAALDSVGLRMQTPETIAIGCNAAADGVLLF
jgi:hypothetical protein